MCVFFSPFPIDGSAGSEMSQIWASPAQEPTATFFGMNTWMSWHAWKPLLNAVSSLSSFSRSEDLNFPPGALTLMIEIFLCGIVQAR